MHRYIKDKQLLLPGRMESMISMGFRNYLLRGRRQVIIAMPGDMIGWSERTVRPPDADLQKSITSRAPLEPHGGRVLSGLSARSPRIQLPAIPGTNLRNPIQFFRNFEKPQGARKMGYYWQSRR